MATEKDIEILSKIRALLAQVNNLTCELSSTIHVEFDIINRTSVAKHFPTPHLHLKADERQRL